MEEPRRLGGRYELGGVLGRGGMAEVYLAHDTRLGRSVAVKTLRADMARDPSFQARFRREAQSAASLNHPAIVAVYDTGEDYIDGISIPYIVMEYVEGSTLRELLHSGRRLLPERALEMTIGILQALEYSHRAGIVHRDIKPANVMLTRQGNVKVMDFGIARAMGDAGMTMTQTSAVIGTAQYLSPEQAKGETVDARSDLYSTGCLLYELLTVRPPFIGDSPVAVAYQHVREEAQPPSSYDPEVRPEVDAIVLKALAKDRDYRYQSADEMRDDIERFLDGLPVAAAQQAAAYGMGGYGYDQNGYPVDHDPYGQTNLLPQQGHGAAPTTMLPPVGQQGGPGYDDGYGGDDGYGEGPRSRRRDDQPKKSNTSWIILAVAAVLVLVGSFFVASAMFKGGGGSGGSTQITVPTLTGKSIADATTAAKAASSKLTVTQGDPIPCNNVAKDLVCQQNPAAGAQMANNGQITVQLSSGPGQSPVPTVTGQTADAATQALTSAGFQVSTQYANDDTTPQNSVVSQTPTGGSQAAPNSQVTIVISQGPGKIAITNVVGQPTAAAVQALQQQGFTSIDSTSKTAPSTNPSQVVGTVAVQNPPANTKTAKGAQITLTIYAAPTQVQLPDLTNMNVKDATAALTAKGFTKWTFSGPSGNDAIVTNTNPPPNTLVDPSTTITLTTTAATPTKGGPIGGTFGSPPFSNPGQAPQGN
ncbi:Stk1 family PASTA domain-containing Ser/Thr kinase [Kitasatospora sp. GAS204B]|uniref:Stk1 family PASTA domain-containing Ser/Thr kinase n=1 Tax=unclassified Kitasatospora TaxID=2633591 RepID=UPI00247647D6|nr:Stk1 family PASTA domain-containing Ser/Thr kinase [Kitasatospora sp. GAS204B]MDH6119644.1 beta-lactam-binding protein with PASTA domain/tRNA A-37 threonylcarbamoyl transferase component Bud32 [Kitasatospora sp. GAS204B]